MPHLHRGAPRHIKLARLSDHAFRVWISALCYSEDLLTDGVLDKLALDSIGVRVKPSDVAELTAIVAPYTSPLWEDHGSYFVMHDYLRWNDSRETVQRARDRIRERVRQSRDKRHSRRSGNGGGNGEANSACNAVTTPVTTTVTPPVTAPVTTPVSTPVSNPHCTEGNIDHRPQTIDHRSTAYGCVSPQPPTHSDTGPPLAARTRTHVAWPGRPNVPGSLHLDLVSKLGGPEDDADRRLRAWYPTVAATWSNRAIGDDDFAFWRARFREWQGTTVPARAVPMMGAGRTAGNAAALQAVLSRPKGGPDAVV